MFKKNIFTLALQIVVIGVFVFIAAGSGTDGAAVSSAARGTGQGVACASAGYTFVGYCSPSDCPGKCKANGYSAYCTGDSTTACYCM